MRIIVAWSLCWGPLFMEDPKILDSYSLLSDVWALGLYMVESACVRISDWGAIVRVHGLNCRDAGRAWAWKVP